MRRAPPFRAAVAVTIAAAAIRLFVAAFTPLFPDETYYWVWSRHLAPGYFDHPPMIALLVRAGTLVAGDTSLGVRLGCIIASALGAYILVVCARRIAGDGAALTTAIVFAVMPLSAAGLVLATPDAPLLATASATLYALLRMIESPAGSRQSLMWWCVAGAWLGLTFDSKYMAVLIPLGVVVACGLRPGLRARFREPGPYVATAISAAVFSPVVLWNAQHHWVSFAFQLQHGFGGGLASALNRELELIGGQVALVSPILFVMCVCVIVRVLRRRADTEAEHFRSSDRDRDALLAIMAVTVFVFFMYSATRRRVEPNWPALAYLPAVLLLSALDGAKTWTRWLRAGVIVAAAISLVAYVNAFTPILPVRAARDPAARAAGWDSLARAMSAATSDTAHRTGGARTLLAADRYQDASELAFHLVGHPDVFSLDLSGRPNQYDLWPRFPDRAAVGDALLVALDDDDRSPPAPAAPAAPPATIDSLAPHFASVAKGSAISLARNGDVIKRLRIWRLDSWRGTWPRSQLRSRP